ncbi:MAG: 50S ribosomal protein L11 methyltransferase [Synergistaceae bacterium]|jgi:ribosomal protein L11 methyltransferase|nr:50S ribosomal protein L11 methyltransferase [Synergistaceae bacterium]
MDDSETTAPFWWCVEIEADSQDALLSLADISGGIGAEVLELEQAGGRTRARVYYLWEQTVCGSTDIDAKTAELNAAALGARVVSRCKVENRNWHTAHIDAFPPLNVGTRLTVTAPWHEEEDYASDGRVTLRINPGAAFGTGRHESTQIALTLLERFVRPGDRVMDVGTGSGILVIAALKLGASHGAARDVDPVAVAEAKSNAAINNIADGALDIRLGSLLDDADDGEFDLLTANILLAPNLALLPSVPHALAKFLPPGTAIFSGMTTEEREIFLAAVNAVGGSVVAELTLDVWWGCAVKFDKS